MGTRTKSIHWAIRITTDDDMQFENLLTNYDWLAYVVESGTKSGRRHYHLAVTFPTTYNNNQMHKYIDAWFSLRGNANRAIKVWDGDDAYIRYLHKENRPKFFGSRLNVKTHEEYIKMEKEYSLENRRKQKLDLYEGVKQLVYSRYSHSYLMNLRGDDLYDFKGVVVDAYLTYHCENRLRLKNRMLMKTDLQNIVFEMKIPSYRAYLKNVLKEF